MTAPSDDSADGTADRNGTDENATALADLALDIRNRSTLAALLRGGRIGYAETDSEGRMHAAVHIRGDELRYDPGILIVPRGGDLDLDFYNDDADTHCALVPSNGDRKWVWLPTRSHGRCTVNLDGPGMYWYGSNVGGDEGRGLVGAIVVRDEPDEHDGLDGGEGRR